MGPLLFTTIREVQSTLGLLGLSAHGFRPRQDAKPPLDLLQPGREFAWSDHCGESRPKANGLVTSEPVIILPIWTHVIRSVDASQFATERSCITRTQHERILEATPLLRPPGFNSQTIQPTQSPKYPPFTLGIARNDERPTNLATLTTKPTHPVRPLLTTPN